MIDAVVDGNSLKLTDKKVAILHKLDQICVEGTSNKRFFKLTFNSSDSSELRENRTLMKDWIKCKTNAKN
jgi:hypothetical protein